MPPPAGFSPIERLVVIDITAPLTGKAPATKAQPTRPTSMGTRPIK